MSFHNDKIPASKNISTAKRRSYDRIWSTASSLKFLCKEDFFIASVLILQIIDFTKGYAVQQNLPDITSEVPTIIYTTDSEIEDVPNLLQMGSTLFTQYSPTEITTARLPQAKISFNSSDVNYNYNYTAHRTVETFLGSQRNSIHVNIDNFAAVHGLATSTGTQEDSFADTSELPILSTVHEETSQPDYKEIPEEAGEMDMNNWIDPPENIDFKLQNGIGDESEKSDKELNGVICSDCNVSIPLMSDDTQSDLIHEVSNEIAIVKSDEIDLNTEHFDAVDQFSDSYAPIDINMLHKISNTEIGAIKNATEMYRDRQRSVSEEVQSIEEIQDSGELSLESENASVDLEDVEFNEELEGSTTPNPIFSVVIAESLYPTEDYGDQITITAEAEDVNDDMEHTTVPSNVHHIIKKQGVTENDLDLVVDLETVFESTTVSTAEFGRETYSDDELLAVTDALDTTTAPNESDFQNLFEQESTSNVTTIVLEQDSASSSISDSLTAAKTEKTSISNLESPGGMVPPLTHFGNLPLTVRSALVITLGSISSIFIISSVFIFLKTYQKQRGTFNIELQEQRCGKDSHDEEYERCLKLLDVEAALPLPEFTGESEKCLPSS